MSPLEGIPASAPDSMDEVVAVLQNLDAALPENDGLAWFNRLYLRVAGAVRDRILAGDFANPTWMAKLEVVFARYYLKALDAREREGSPPACWRALFSRRADPSLARIQFALAGINAHINHDLPLALIDVFETAGIEPEHGGVQYGDYTSLNPAIAGLIDVARQEWSVTLAGDALQQGNRLEDILAVWSLAAAREAAWTNAELLWGVRDSPLVAGRYLDVVDGLASVAGRALLIPA